MAVAGLGLAGAGSGFAALDAVSELEGDVGGVGDCGVDVVVA